MPWLIIEIGAAIAAGVGIEKGIEAATKSIFQSVWFWALIAGIAIVVIMWVRK